MVLPIFHLDQVLYYYIHNGIWTVMVVKGNFCFHAVFSTGNWYGTSLRFIDQTIQEKFKDKLEEVVEKLKEDLYSKIIKIEMKEVRE